MNLQFLWVDAFTSTPLAGNPCAVVFDADALTDARMQAIAKEFNLSETAFVQKSSVADWKVRYFTPEQEIPLAGHPTIATTHALIETGRLALKSDKNIFTLELKDGPIEVEVHQKSDGKKQITMTQREPLFLASYDKTEVSACFGINAQDILDKVPVQTVSTGTPMLMVPLKNLEVLKKIQMNFSLFSELQNSGDFFSPHLFCLSGATSEGQTFARHLGMPPDTLEDPFTGSATGAMGAYLWRYDLINSPTFTAQQGHWMGRPGQANVEIIGPKNAMQSVKVGGSAVTVFKGEILL